jgi:hypothetical protein
LPPYLSRRHAIAATAAALFAARHPALAQDDGTNVPDPHTEDGGKLKPSQPTPTAEAKKQEASGEPGEGAIFPENRVLSYYGFPGNPYMGILGEYSKEDLLAKLQEQAAEYEAADSSRSWKLAFEVIASVAQADAGADGLYIMPTDPEVVQEYIDFTAANDLLLILDVQFGLDTVENELDRLRDYLRNPHVHPALDPEFMMKPGEQPGVHLGAINAEKVTYAQETVAKWAQEDGVPEKFLIVHQFNYYMIEDKENIGIVDGVQLVIDADGWGPPADKQASYDVVITQSPIQYNGIKNFYGQDDPLMSAAETMAFEPQPDLVIYQ